MRSRLPLLALMALLAGCATTAPERPPAPDELAIIATPMAPLPLAIGTALPAPTVPAPFSPLAAAELETLPAPAEDLWTRIRKGTNLPDLDDGYVAKWEEWYASRPDYVARMIDRSRRYLYYIVLEVEQRGMPLELALLPMVESAYNPVAISSARAAGIWQFMPSTGKHYGLKQNFWFDARRDVVAATDGALNYLKKLHEQFGDWQLALAAYNWGEGNVARAIARNQKAGLPTDYASLAMPDETRNYLPKLQAVKNIIRDPEKYGLELADVPDAPYFAIVRTTRTIDVKRAAELAEMSQDEFQYLNPHHNRPVIAGADEHAILLPIDKAELFAAKLELADQPLVSWQAYRMHRGETLPQVAAKFALPVESLRAVNGIGPKARLHEGHTLLVPSQRPTAQSEAALGQAVFTTVPQGRTFYYRVQRGETLAAIATRYGVTTQDIRGWNGMVHASVRVGQQLRITSDFGPNAARAKRASGKPVLTTRVKSAPRAKAALKNGKATASRRAKTTGR
ncbi:MAG: transglycosylase SLT domain-containing protein [Betaproteobacteria bacterium]|nr:transglycosylase SLT domain-containing protein [Betaproteobacteria bacterium]